MPEGKPSDGSEERREVVDVVEGVGRGVARAEEDVEGLDARERGAHLGGALLQRLHRVRPVGHLGGFFLLLSEEVEPPHHDGHRHRGVHEDGLLDRPAAIGVEADERLGLEAAGEDGREGQEGEGAEKAHG